MHLTGSPWLIPLTEELIFYVYINMCICVIRIPSGQDERRQRIYAISNEATSLERVKWKKFYEGTCFKSGVCRSLYIVRLFRRVQIRKVRIVTWRVGKRWRRFQEQSVTRGTTADTSITRCTKHRLRFMTGSETNCSGRHRSNNFDLVRCDCPSRILRQPKFFLPTFDTSFRPIPCPNFLLKLQTHERKQL